MEIEKHILVAEDDTAVRDSLERALRYEGYDVSAVSNGSQALELAAERAPDLYILDVMMPVVDGLSVCRTIRRSGDKTPVLVLTAKHEVSDRVEGLDAGADDYLIKRLLERGRQDDNEQVIINRLQIYREKTSPLIDLYSKQGILVEIEGNADIDVVFSCIEKALG